MAESSLTVRAELAGLRRDIQSAGNMTEGQATAMVISLEKRLKSAEKAAKSAAKASKEAKDATKEWERGLDGVKNSAEKLSSIIGGPLGDIADLTLDLGEKMSGAAGAIGAAGVAAGVAVAAVAALAVGAKALADAAVVSRDRLIEQGLAAAIPAESSASIAHYQTATADLRTELDLLTVSLGAGVAESMGDVSHAAIGMIEAFGRLGDLVPGLPEPLAKIGEALSWVDPLAWEMWLLNKSFEGYVAIGEQAAATTREIATAAKEATAATADLAASYVHFGPFQEDLAEGERKIAEAHRKAEEALRRETKASADAVAVRRELLAINDQEIAQLQAVEDAKAQASINEMRWAEAQRAGAASSAELTADIADLNAALALANEHFSGGALLAQAWGLQIKGTLEATLGPLGDFADAIADRRIEKIQEEMDARRKALDEWRAGELEMIDRMVESGALSEKQAVLERRRIEEETRARRAAIQRQTKVEREAAMKAFETAQSLQRAAAVVDSFRAGVALMPAFAFLGPGAPVAAAGVAALGLAAALAGINAADPPEFPMGSVPTTSTSGSPDHTDTVRKTPQEAIANPRGTAILTPQVIEAANRGTAPGPSTVVIQLDGRDFARAVFDGHGRASPTPGSWVAGRRPLYGGR